MRRNVATIVSVESAVEEDSRLANGGCRNAFCNYHRFSTVNRFRSPKMYIVSGNARIPRPVYDGMELEFSP